jgi:hypothetical protein
MIAFHDSRLDGNWYTAARIQAEIVDMRSGAAPQQLPAYFQEPDRWTSEGANARQSHYTGAASAAKLYGAAAWTFHTDAGYILTGTRTFQGSLGTQEAAPGSGTEKSAFEAINGALGTTWGACAYSLTPASQAIGAAGGSGFSVSVTVSSGCAWSAASSAPWLTITAGGSGSGAGTVQFAVAPNSSQSGRQATITAGGKAATVTQLAQASPPAARIGSDYDGDGHSDLAVFRPTATTTNWYIRLSGAGYTTTLSAFWGNPSYDNGFMPVPGDYDGDGKTDIAVWSPHQGWWFILKSSTNFTSSVSYFWGDPAYSSSIVPVPADYDADGVTDLAVWVRSTGEWFVKTSSSGFTTSMPVRVWGSLSYDPNFVPVPADYDGDKKADPAVWSPATGNWFILKSTTGYSDSLTKLWGNPGYDANFKPIAADYDGDGLADLAVWSPATGNWFIAQSSSAYNNSFTTMWGTPTYGPFVPVVEDIDGDGRADIALWRPASGTWYWLTSSSAFQSSGLYEPWGIPGDIPTPHNPRDFPRPQ